jgi:hypothetical protein
MKFIHNREVKYLGKYLLSFFFCDTRRVPWENTVNKQVTVTVNPEAMGFAHHHM